MGYQDKPAAERIPAIEACIADLQKVAKQLRKQKQNRDAGCVIDNIVSLEEVVKWGSHGGKVPYPVSEPSLSVFKKHGIEDLIHAPWKPRHRASRPLSGYEPKPAKPKKSRKATFVQKLDHWARQIGDHERLEVADVTRSELRKALPVYRSEVGLHHWTASMRKDGSYPYALQDNDIVGLGRVIQEMRNPEVDG